MGYIELSKRQNSGAKIMIFTEGTILGPKSVFSLYSIKSYIPIGGCVGLIDKWHEQGARIVYCTSRKDNKAQDIARMLKDFGFAGERLYYRGKKQRYKDIVEEVMPDILIEDDCKSIGGKRQMCITYVSGEVKQHIKSIVVKEFGGIDHLGCFINSVFS